MSPTTQAGSPPLPQSQQQGQTTGQTVGQPPAPQQTAGSAAKPTLIRDWAAI